MSSPPSKLVIPVVAGIGNALLAVPMVRALKRARPEAHITILARIDAIGEVFRRLPQVDEVIVTGKGLKGLWRMVRASRQRRPDVYLIPFPSNRWQYALLALTSGARRRILHGYPIGYWRAMHFIGQRVPAQKGLHDVEQNLRLLSAFDPARFDGGPAVGSTVGSASADRLFPARQSLPTIDRSTESNNRSAEANPTPSDPEDSPDAPTFALTDQDRAGADALLREAGFAPADRPIVIHAGSARTVLAKAKRWAPRSYASLIDAIGREMGVPVCLIEGPDEEGVADEILAFAPIKAAAESPIEAAVEAAPEGAGRNLQIKVIRLTGSLGVAGALLERARLYVGSDSGLAHLAGAVGTPAVTLFAPADPDRVSPFRYRHLVVQAPTSCSPCFQYPWQATHPCMRCREPMCINTITVEMVMEKVRSALPNEQAAAVIPSKLDSVKA